MFSDIKAAIFDLDGTLIDSMGLWNSIDINYLKKFNLAVPERLQDDICHLNFQETAAYFKDRFNIPDSLDKIMADWHNMAYDAYCTSIKLKKGVVEFLQFLKDSNIKIALATSNSNDLLEASLKANKIYDFFDAITTTSEVERNKEFPDVYLLAAKKLSVAPESCMVFEDLPTAIKGAKKGNMKVVGIYDAWNEDQWSLIKSLSDYSIKDYRELLIKN